MLARLLFPALVLLATALVFALGFVVGAGEGVDRMRQQAIDEGYAVRSMDADGRESFRWKSSAELERRPARRSR